MILWRLMWTNVFITTHISPLQDNRACIFSMPSHYTERDTSILKAIRVLRCSVSVGLPGSLLFAMEHLLKNSLGEFWGFKDQQNNTTLLGYFIFGALQYWQMPSHFIMLQSWWQKCVAASRDSPHGTTKNRVLKGKVWHMKSCKQKKS